MKDCWNCAHVQLGGLSFPAACKWFERKGEPARQIPPEIIDVACRQWRPNDDAR